MVNTQSVRVSARFPKELVLYEDNHVLVINKPACFPVQGDATGDPSVLDMIKSYVKQQSGKPGSVYMGLVHRLDRPASGLMVFGKTSKAAGRLSTQFRERSVGKLYLCMVNGRLKDLSGELVHNLFNDMSGKNRVLVQKAGGRDRGHGRVSSMSYDTLLTESYMRQGDGGSEQSLLEVSLNTGRKHQIRAQLAHIG